MSERNNQQAARPPLRRAASRGVNAQKDGYNKAWYGVLFTAMTHLAEHAYIGAGDPKLEDDYDDPIEKAKAIEEYKKESINTYYTKEEVEQLKVPYSKAANNEITEVGRLLTNTYNFAERDSNSLQDEHNACFELGLVGTKVCHEMGKAYHQWLDRIPADDPLRKEKATYLVMKEQYSIPSVLMQGYKSFQQRQSMNLANFGWKDLDRIRRNSPFKDPEALKKMTLKDFCHMSLMNPDQTRDFITKNKLKTLDVTENTNAFDYFVARKKESVQEYRDGVERQFQAKGEKSPRTKMKEAGWELVDDIETDALKLALEVHEKSMHTKQIQLGRDYGRSKLSPEDQKLVDDGAVFFQTLNYEVPKSLRGWVNEGDKMIRENRIQRMNNSYEALDKSIYSGQSLGVENDPIFKNAIGVKREADPYDQYLSVFTSEKALRLSPAKRRHALANAMAAAALKDAKKPYDKERIQERGKALMKKDVFKNMSDLDVARALFNPKAVNQARFDLTVGLYGVPKENQRAYLQQMKQLSQNMLHGSEGSKDYQRMVDGIADIGRLDPDDPNLEAKLIQANERLSNSIKVYAKGKKSVRVFQDGRDKFDNCLDTLSVMKKNVPGMEQDARELVDRTNEVRKVSQGDDNYVDLENYGAERAREVFFERRIDQARQNPQEPLQQEQEFQMQI